MSEFQYTQCIACLTDIGFIHIDEEAYICTHGLSIEEAVCLFTSKVDNLEDLIGSDICIFDYSDRNVLEFSDNIFDSSPSEESIEHIRKMLFIYSLDDILITKEDLDIYIPEKNILSNKEEKYLVYFTPHTAEPAVILEMTQSQINEANRLYHKGLKDNSGTVDIDKYLNSMEKANIAVFVCTDNIGGVKTWNDTRTVLNEPTPPIEEAYIISSSYEDRDCIDQDTIHEDMRDIANLLEPFTREKSLNEKRNEFMEFFRSDEFNEALDANDCVEVFRTCMKGSTDFTPNLLNEIFTDYSVNLEVSTIKE